MRRFHCPYCREYGCLAWYGGTLHYAPIYWSACSLLVALLPQTACNPAVPLPRDNTKCLGRCWPQMPIVDWHLLLDRQLRQVLCTRHKSCLHANAQLRTTQSTVVNCVAALRTSALWGLPSCYLVVAARGHAVATVLCFLWRSLHSLLL
jgi:hypothetical protein